MSAAGSRLRLGPIVGHTDHRSTRIWIRSHGDPSACQLRVEGQGLFPFLTTGERPASPGTAVAVVDGLQAGRRYRYRVVSRGRVLGGSRGSVRTMPDPRSPSEITFVALSCNHPTDEGAWRRLHDFVREAQPHFLLMMGDQVYMDQHADPGDVWARHRSSRSRERFSAMTEKYQRSWSRDFLRDLMANTPTYMMWDDHDVRDGWGSWAPDSPTLAERHRPGRSIFAKHEAYFEDARDAFWHFQMSHNPPPGVNLLGQDPPPDVPGLAEPPARGVREAMPFTLRCGRVGLVVLDSRGERDVWRAEKPVLGTAQWEFLAEILANLDPELEAIIVVTPVPIVTHSPEGQAQTFLGRRTDDVDLFKRGDEQGLLALMGAGTWSPETEGAAESAMVAVAGKPAADIAGALISGHAAEFGASPDLGGVRLGDIDDVRDQWSHAFSRPEQADLIRWAGEARLANRSARRPRSVLFVGGDLHAGGLFDVACQKPAFRAACLFASGISQNSPSLAMGVTVDEHFQVAPGITAKLQKVVTDYNFGVVQVVPTGATPSIIPSLVHEGEAWTVGLDFGLHEFPFGGPPGISLPAG